MDTKRYKKIVDLPMEYDKVRVTTYVPKPSEVDYKKGYVVRYFVQRTNDENAPVYEVKRQSLSNYKGNPFYKITQLDWRITGDREDIKYSNLQSITIASEEMPAIVYQLPNLLQLSKNGK